VFNLGPVETMVIFVIVLLIFGPSQLPKLARSIGNAMREFRKARNEFSDELNKGATEPKPDAPHKPADTTPPANKPIQ
jgi:sec-independent protein translocase protein TatA